MANVKIWCVKGGISDLSNFADNLVSTLISQINANQLEIQRQKSISALNEKEFSDYSNARIFAMNGKLMGRYTTRLYGVSEEEMPEICQKLKKFNLFPANR